VTTPDRKGLRHWFFRPRVAAAIGLLVLVITPLLSASPASALSLPDPLGCNPSAPDPQRPDGRLSGWLTTKPNPLPPDENPFAPGAHTSIYDQYGTAGNYWPTYDLGCGPHPETIWTDLSNLGLEGSSTVLNLTAQLRHFAWSTSWIQSIDKAVQSVNADLKGYFEVMMGLAFIFVGGYAIWRSSKAEYGETATTSGWAILLLALGATLLNFPVMAGRTFDNITVTGAHTVSNSLSGNFANTAVPSAQTDSAISHVNDDALYRIWLRGMFGDDKSATAQKYGPLLYPTMAYTWRETQVLDTDRAAGQKITDAKKAAFKTIASQLKDEDPGAYTHMQGKTAVFVRFPLSIMAFAIVLVLCLFMAMAALLLFVARIAARAFIMGAPVIAPFAIIHRWSSPMQRLFGFVSTTVTNLLAFTVAGGLVSLIVTGLLASSLPLWLSALIVLGVTALGWSATKPYRSFMHQVGLGNLASSRGMLAPLANYVGTRRAVRDGLADHEEEAIAGFDMMRARDEEYSAPPPSPMTTSFGRRWDVAAEAGSPATAGAGSAGYRRNGRGALTPALAADPRSRAFIPDEEMSGDGPTPALPRGGDGQVFVLTDEGVYEVNRHRRPMGGADPAPLAVPSPSSDEESSASPSVSTSSSVNGTGTNGSSAAVRPRAVQVPYEPLECHLALDDEGREVYAIYSRPDPPARVNGTDPVVYQDS
jgi:hypothetical protein